ncbi:unnamed protein product [Symbiodinium necroappetens]|uniref:Uncharacterized protein n=1 Tax=Symbiodinium necroappetens TaxID=1628268 RepID=A0A812P4P7_9DINO|nr:unnamed protein product [Symbiodinium necroappetens]
MALDHGVLENLFGRFVAYLGRLADQISAEGVSATMERASPERVHLHAYLHLSTAFHRRGQDALNIFAFEGVRPHVTPNTASGKTYTGAVRFGHFYVVADKLGTLFNYTNYPPFKAYGVEGWWLDNLLKAGKLSRKAYLKMAAQVTVGFQKRLADCKAAERYLRDEALQDAICAHAKALEPATLPMKSFPVIEEFVACHDGSSRFRRPILAIVGKSLESEQMDLAEFDRRIHAGVILDGVGDALFLKRHREALQGRPKMVKDAKSATNVYSYAYSFCGRAVVATFDLSAQNLGELESDHWLCNRDNVRLLKLNETAYVEPADVYLDSPPAYAARADQRKRRWIGSPPRCAALFPGP